jgi:ribonucleotide reductase alpha subunit
VREPRGTGAAGPATAPTTAPAAGPGRPSDPRRRRSEALFMQKKLMVIPMKGQYEQHCNAAALKDLGVPVLKSLKLKHVAKIQKWLDDNSRIEVDYPDETEETVNKILADATFTMIKGYNEKPKKPSSVKKFQYMILKSITKDL